MSLLLATTNRGKLAEFQRLLAPIPLVGPHDLGLQLTVIEDGDTFAANALLKAAAFATGSGSIALADDSGLAVDALEGAPGVHSARYGGAGLEDRGRCALLLQNIGGVKREDRSARFHCCLAVVAPDGRQCTAAGVCEGYIADAAAGEGGFGYDPVFYLPAYGRTVAQLKPAEKDAVSHRARAVTALLPLLRETFPELAG